MWNQVVVIGLGLWLMASPHVMGYEGAPQTNHHVVGPLIVSFGLIALSETTRSVRWLNVGLGLWLLMAPFILGYSALHSTVVGAAIFGLSFLEGTRREQLGGGWTRLWKRSPDSARPLHLEDSVEKESSRHTL